MGEYLLQSGVSPYVRLSRGLFLERWKGTEVGNRTQHYRFVKHAVVKYVLWTVSQLLVRNDVELCFKQSIMGRE